MRVLYGVMGDARGHLTRARCVAEALPEADILFVGGGRVDELKALGFPVEPVPMAATRYRGTRVALGATLSTGLGVLLGASSVVQRLAQVMRRFDPDLILSDYELFVPRAARRLRRAAVSLDHQHVLTHCRLEPPAGTLLSRILTVTLVRTLYGGCARHIVTSFFPAPARAPAQTDVFGPLVRAAARRQESRDGDHVLVYQTSPCFEPWLSTFARLGRPVRLYGMPPRADQGLLSFRSFSDQGFLADLASCAYVVCNGSHGLLSEAFFLGKPVLALPLRLAYEQRVNADQLARLGLGEAHDIRRLSLQKLTAFESRLDQYRARVRGRRTDDGGALAVRLRELARQRPSA
jgi:uncharacterized protein (TIGR00661 family)